MAKAAPKLEWCVVRLGEDMNWWVEEISDEVHWDVDGLSIIDPRQMNHIIDQIDLLREYDFQDDIYEAAFYRFKIDKQLDNNRLRLVRTRDSIADTEDMLFYLPDIIDEEKGPYADLIDHMSRLRVRMLNDSIDLEQKLTVEDLEEEIREEQNNDFLEGRAVHVFREVNSVLEYVPAGFELDADPDDDDEKPTKKAIDQDFSDIEVEVEEKIEEDETMKWDEDEEEESEEEGEEEGGPPPPPDADGEESLDDLEDEDEKK
ncbi:hypothetical protein [Rubellicoccus peritrichatus]|uniref:Uncharacterized protein n=1 Tax=Rubellicoccus peritrichatus TaxID=3080537 RepID=A0AAQ3QUK0_9BACT|nr:hypothetical protein [Puniceicoccus sp. CR14]WOO40005.1 hypothetical protein RZN69_15385 [Puniceicoccus sp. CR14]